MTKNTPLVKLNYDWCRPMDGEGGSGTVETIVPHEVDRETWLAGFKAGYTAYAEEADCEIQFKTEPRKPTREDDDFPF